MDTFIFVVNLYHISSVPTATAS